MSHPMHNVDGASTAARGKGACGDGKCDFLIAAPVKSFTSGDSNRDLHMVETVRGAEFPMVVVRTTLPQNMPDGAIYADLEVQFAGQTAHYQHVPFAENHQRKPSAHHGNGSGNLLRFQDRAADVPDRAN